MEPWYSLHWFNPAQWQQFHIANPLALSLIPAILLLFSVRYYLHRNAQQRLNMSLGQLNLPRVRGKEIRAQTTRSLLSLLRYLLPISVFAGVALVLVALARPQIVREQRDEQSEGIDIMMAIDVSESMSDTDLPPTRLAAARRVAQTFVNGRKNDRIGLVVFAGEAFSLCPLTTDYDLVKQYLNDLNDRMIRTSGTAIGDALARCINRMRDRSNSPTDTTRQEAAQWNQARSKVIILLSDGDNTAGNIDPVTAARLAKIFNIRIYTIAVGQLRASTSQAGTVDEGILKTIATIGNGSFFRATDTRRLRAVFAQISKLEKSPVRVRVYEDVQDYYRNLSLLGNLLPVVCSIFEKYNFWKRTGRLIKGEEMLRSYYNADVVEAGLDEVGRGCLAGPVVAAAVILPKDYTHPILNDSKQLSRRQREILKKDIERDALAWAVAEVSHEDIDRINILKASFLAMHRAVDRLTIKPEHLLVDGNRFTPYPMIPHTCIIKGDANFLSIAAASVLAKTYRDDLMEQLGQEFPAYGWAKNVGYPTPIHRAAIREFGPTKYHRMSFRLL